MQIHPMPGLEITTVFGCKIQCKYCPQDILLQSHLSGMHRLLQPADFELVCKKLPKPFRLHFTGFSEPFHNPHCAEMLRFAFSQGFQLKLSTTLSGFQLKDIDIFEARKCYRTILHLPSVEELMNLSITERYVESLQRVLTTLQAGDLVLTFGSGFHASLAKLLDACADDVETKVILPESEDWYTRAGNNVLFKKTPNLTDFTRIRCSKDRLYQNVMLPDGTVVLCCMDWSGKHVLGNLFRQSYEELIAGGEFQRVIRGLDNNCSGTLCWKCEYAVPA